MKTILFQGDSITDADRIRDNETNLGFGYATLVAAELGRDCPNQYKMINRGIGGNRITDLYARLEQDIINVKPDIISILVGVNDAILGRLFHMGINAEKYYKIYSILIEEIQEALPDVKIMIMEPYVLKGSVFGVNMEECRPEVEKRAKMARKIAEKYNLIFIPLQEEFDQLAKEFEDSCWTSDGVHPTLAGHELIKRAWLKGFSQIK